MRKQYKIILFILILFISIGFAYLTANLDITGSITFKDNIWDVHLENIVVDSDSVDADKPVINNDNTSTSFSISMNRPGDYYEFYVDVVNNGTMDATLDSVTRTSLTGDYATYLNYSVTYYSDREITKGDLLRSGLKERIKVRVEYKYDLDTYKKLDDINLSLSLKYIKTDTHDPNYNSLVWNFDSKAEEDIFIVPKSGTYKLETWGAQGGSAYDTGNNLYAGGYGGYSVGNIDLVSNEYIFINVGGAGTNTTMLSQIYAKGGYNGGGNARWNDSPYFSYNGSGGGATHMSKSTGLLNTFKNKTSELYLVAGAGGGSVFWNGDDRLSEQFGIGGSGGGYMGNNGTDSYPHNIGFGGTQDSGGIGCTGCYSGSFGLGGASNRFATAGTGGGAGYYGGSGSYDNSGAGGGSGYIGNPNLTDKIMYCYNCQESISEPDETHIKTRSTTNVSETPTSNYAKIGHGYARITYVG